MSNQFDNLDVEIQRYIQEQKKQLENRIKQGGVDPIVVFSQYLKNIAKLFENLPGQLPKLPSQLPSKAAKKSISRELNFENALKEAEKNYLELINTKAIDLDDIAYYTHSRFLLDYIHMLNLEAMDVKAQDHLPDELKPYKSKQKREAIKEYIEDKGLDLFVNGRSKKYQQKMLLYFKNLINRSLPILEKRIQALLSSKLRDCEINLKKMTLRELKSMMDDLRGILASMEADSTSKDSFSDESYIEMIELQIKRQLNAPQKREIESLVQKLEQEINHKELMLKKLKTTFNTVQFSTRVKAAVSKKVLPGKLQEQSKLQARNKLQIKDVDVKDAEIPEEQDNYNIAKSNLEKYYFNSRYNFRPAASLDSDNHHYLKENLMRYSGEFVEAQRYLFKMFDMKNFSSVGAMDTISGRRKSYSKETRRYIEEVLKSDAINFILTQGYFAIDPPFIRIDKVILDKYAQLQKNALASFEEIQNLPRFKNPIKSIDLKFKEYLMTNILDGTIPAANLPDTLKMLQDENMLLFFEKLYQKTLDYKTSIWHGIFSRNSRSCAPQILIEFLQSSGPEALSAKVLDFVNFNSENAGTVFEINKSKATDFKRLVRSAYGTYLEPAPHAPHPTPKRT